MPSTTSTRRPALRHLGIRLIPYSPLRAGLLTGALESATEGDVRDESMLQRVTAHRDRLEAYEELCRELGAKPAHMALSWVLHNPAVPATVT